MLFIAAFVKNIPIGDIVLIFEIIEEKSDLIEVNKLIKTVGGKKQFIDLHKEYLKKFIQSFEIEI